MGTGALQNLKVWLHRRQRPDRYALLDGLQVTQALTREQILRKQQEDLRAIVRFAAENTDYYRDRFGTLSEDFDFSRLPILTKPDVVVHMSDLLVRGADQRTTPIGHTGGSTGKPLAFYYDEAKHELMRAGMMRSYMMSGWRPGQKILNFWGARQDTVSGGVFGNSGWDDFIAAEKTLPAHEINPSKLHDWVSFIQSYRPVLLQGYASILAALARFVIDNKLNMPASLSGVYSTAEVLDDSQRRVMEQAFGCRVFNQYGSREIPNIACECRHGNMHVFTDMVWLESLGGQLIVTSLTNRLMPMIRYEIGDSGSLKDGECDCGSPLPLMEMGMCRQNDLILAPDGRRLHPSFFNRLLYGLTQIEQYQFVQDEPGKIALKVVAAMPLDAALVATLRDSLRNDAGLAFELDYVREIERTVSGKHRFVISRL
jgi:phenylacetate-CoA ligase